MRMQPTFRVPLPWPKAEAAERLGAALRSGDLAADADAAGSCLDFRVPVGERRVWSPHLSVQLVDGDEADAPSREAPDAAAFASNGPVSVAIARFAPRPEVWTLVMMLYFFAAFVAICGAIYGWVQALLAVTPWGFLAVPAGLAMIAALHGVSVVGQRLSAHQMTDLRARFDRVVAAASGHF